MRAGILLLFLCSCAGARMGPDGSVTAWALGQARVERCAVVDGQQVCISVAGGPVSEGLLGSVTSLFRALLPAALGGAS